jgi:hypothetical protein
MSDLLVRLGALSPLFKDLSVPGKKGVLSFLLELSNFKVPQRTYGGNYSKKRVIIKLWDII